MVSSAGRALKHFTFHLVDILLCLFDHLYRLLPLLLECCLRFLDFLLLYLYPSVNLLLLELEAARGDFILLEELLNMPPLLTLFIFEIVFSELDQFRVFTVLHYVLQLFLGVLLEGIPVEK